MKRIIAMLGIAVFSMTGNAAENNVYDFSWLDQEKEVYVLQNRKFRKKNQFYIGGTLGRSVSGAFVDSSEYNLIAGYFFAEEWGLEFSFTGAEGTLNATHDAVAAQGSTAYYRQIQTANTAMLVWSPLYSKINTFNKIFYFDWMFGLGFTSASTEDNRNKLVAGPNTNVLTEEDVSGVAWMTAFRFYINQDWSARVDFRGTHLNVDSAIDASGSTINTEKRWNNYYNFNVGINYAF